MELSEAQMYAFRPGYIDEVDPNSRGKAKCDKEAHLRRSIGRLKMFAGVERFKNNQHTLDSLECFRGIFISSQYNELKEYYSEI